MICDLPSSMETENIWGMHKQISVYSFYLLGHSLTVCNLFLTLTVIAQRTDKYFNDCNERTIA